MATLLVNRAVSSTPAWPNTRFLGNPEASWASAVISSSGLDTTMITASGDVLGDVLGDPAHDLGVDLEQVHPAHAGLARQAGGDDDDVGALGGLVAAAVGVVVAPTTVVSKPSIGRDWLMSSASPSGLPSMMSVSTTVSKMSYSARRCAVVDP